MRAPSGIFAAALFLAGTNGSDAATRLSPKEIQAGFFNGQPFTSATPSNMRAEKEDEGMLAWNRGAWKRRG